MRARLLALLLVVAPLAGCASDEGIASFPVPYPKLGDVVEYEARGALVEFARWENAKPLPDPARVQLEVAPSAPALDGARAVHPAFAVTTSMGFTGAMARQSVRYVATAHESVVQSLYPLSQDQSIVAFDERGFPWLFGASALLGRDLAVDRSIPFELPDNLGRRSAFNFSWEVVGPEAVDGVETMRLDLRGPSMEGSLWMERGTPYPLKVRLVLLDDALAPHVRADGPLPARFEAKRVLVIQGSEGVPPRDSSAEFRDDATAKRENWDGKRPPDGDPGYVPYPLGEAVAHAELLDKGLQDWQAAAEDPRLYRATFQEHPAVLPGATDATWLLQFVDKGGRYYQVVMNRTSASLLGQTQGVPRVESSAPAQAPADRNHGWFARESVRGDLVPLGEAVRITQRLFGHNQTQVWLRSFTDPPGYSYFLDGGFERPGGRFTVVYNPATGFVEEATGPVTPRLAPAG